MAKTAAILYTPDAYDTRGKRLLGRQSAGEGFLKSLVKYHHSEALYCYTENSSNFQQFCQQIQPWLETPQKVRWIPSNQPNLLSEAGVLYRPDPCLSDLVWQRRFFDPKSYSICGVTHTIATKNVMELMGELLTVPVQPWDALICTSQAVKKAIEYLLETWGDYLQKRMGGQPFTPIQLPIIPLGVDITGFPQGEEAKNTRQKLRQQFGITENDIVVLFVGRFCFSAKAHPVPMYIALEESAKQTDKTIYFIQVGWFDDEREKPYFKKSAQTFSPSIRHIFLEGRDPLIRREIWSSADIFISLADNIQETFGLTPIEAMANGLPTIVSDWDGYQESVRHGVDGFRIPSWIPATGSLIELTREYFDDTMNWPTYIGYSSMTISVDIQACSQYLIRLINEPELRKKMGENGRQRTQLIYDWRVIIQSYENLWESLSECRQKESELFPRSPENPPYPLCDDPLRVFAHYSTHILDETTILRLGNLANSDDLTALHTIWITNFGNQKRLPKELQEKILNQIQKAGAITVGDLIKDYGKTPQEWAILQRTILYWLKFNVLVNHREESLP